MDHNEHAVHPIEGGDLLAFVDGAASPEAAAHIASCPECLAEARALGGMAALFGAALDRDDCPAPGELLDYSMGFAEPLERDRIEQHVAGCERCAAELAELNRIDDARAPAQKIPQLWGPIGIAPVPDVRRLLARPVAAPSRGVAVRGEERRRLVWEAGDYRIVLSLLAPGIPEQGWRVEGQISLSADGDAALVGAPVSLLAGETQAASDAIDDLGYFALEPVPAGQYALEIAAGDGIITIQDLDLQ